MMIAQTINLPPQVLQTVERLAPLHGCDPRIMAALIWVESRGRPDKVTVAGTDKHGGKLYAVGLTQVIANAPGFDERPAADQLKKPPVAIEWGCKILREFGGDRDLETALYHYSGGSDWKDRRRYRSLYWEPFVEAYTAMWGEEPPARNVGPGLVGRIEECQRLLYELRERIEASPD